jgi:hypothetical protein
VYGSRLAHQKIVTITITIPVIIITIILSITEITPSTIILNAKCSIIIHCHKQ